MSIVALSVEEKCIFFRFDYYILKWTLWLSSLSIDKWPTFDSSSRADHFLTLRKYWDVLKLYNYWVMIMWSSKIALRIPGQHISWIYSRLNTLIHIISAAVVSEKQGTSSRLSFNTRLLSLKQWIWSFFPMYTINRWIKNVQHSMAKTWSSSLSTWTLTFSNF